MALFCCLAIMPKCKKMSSAFGVILCLSLTRNCATMKNIFFLTLLLSSIICSGQTNIVVSSSTADKVMKGNYNPTEFTEGLNVDIRNLPAAFQEEINPDSLKAYIIKLASFRNRNSGSDTVSNETGIGAARRWVYQKFEQFGQATPRLIPSYFQFDQSICSVNRHRNILAVLPGTQVVDPSIVVVEGHIDSRCDDVCDIECVAEGVEDNASGTALVMELARVMGKYQLNRTIVFMVTIGEEQGLIGAGAFAQYCVDEDINVRAVFNNDVVGGILCGKTASPPGCVDENAVDSTSVRIFSFGEFNSTGKGLARFAKLQYQEDLLPIARVPMTIRIMTPEDRGGRGGDHIPFRQNGFAALRYCAANEHGDASGGSGYEDRQHTEDDILGVDTDNDNKIDSFFVDFNYLARNTVLNGVSALSAASGPLGTGVDIRKINEGIEVTLSPKEETGLYKIGFRTSSNDFDTIYTTTQLVDTFPRIAGAFQLFVSAATVDELGIESLFDEEKRVFTPVGIDEMARSEKDITIIANRPNPFDEATYLMFDAKPNMVGKTAVIKVTDMQGKVVKELNTTIKPGVNEVLYRHGYLESGSFFFTVIVEDKNYGSHRMIYAN